MSLLRYTQNQHATVVQKSHDEIVFLHLWCYANFRDSFLIPVMNIESKRRQDMMCFLCYLCIV